MAATLSDLQKVLSRFTIEEFFDDVLPNLPGVSWKSIKKTALRELNDFNTMKVMAKFIIQDKAIQNMDENALKNMLAVMKLIDVSHHSSRFIWTAYQLVGCSTDSPMDDYDAKTALIRECRLLGLHAIVKVITFKNLQWVSITLKKIIRGSGQRYQRPLIFACTKGYLFLYMRTVHANLMLAIKSALQYKGVKKIKLRGKSLESLLKCLKMKEQHALEKKADYVDAGTYKKNGSSFEFAQDERRKKYAEYLFGQDPPILEEIIVTTKECPWKGKKIIDEASPSKYVNSRVIYHSNHVYSMLKKMTEQHFPLPFPEFLKQLPVLGKNDIHIIAR